MKNIGMDLELRAERAIEDALANAPNVEFRGTEAELLRDGTIRSDLIVDVKTRQGIQKLAVEVSYNGQPRYARNAVNNLVRLRTERPELYPVFIAPYISPTSGEMCDRENVGYIDFSGNCKLAFADTYIERTGNPNKHKRRAELRGLYSPKAERVLRALLNNPRRVWKDRDLADAANVSIGHVSNVKKRLTDLEWVHPKTVGWNLSEPEALLHDWAEQYDASRNKRYGFYSLEGVEMTESKLSAELSERSIRHAFTSFSAAARWAPAARYNTVSVYIMEPDNLEFDTIKPVQTGANVELIVPRDEGVIDDGVIDDSLDQRGLRVVGPVQTYLDLQLAGGRSEEACAALLEYIREFRWRRASG